MSFTYISNQNIFIVAAGIFLFAYLQIFSDLYYVSAIGASFFLVVFFKFVRDIGHKIEPRDLVAFMSVLQWVFGPILAYNVLPYDELYWMDVPEDVYMNFVVPGTLAFILGMYFPLVPDKSVKDEHLEKVKEYIKANKYVAFILIGGGLFAQFASKYVPGSLGFLFLLLSNLQFVGVYLLLFTESKFKWLFFGGVMLLVIFSAILMGMFGELVLHLMFSFLVVGIVLKMPLWGKIALISFGFFMILVLQSSKDEYRKATWYSTSSKSNQEIFKDIIVEKITTPSSLFEAHVLENMGARTNQGWIIARIMGHMPKKRAFVKGETITTGIYAGILPRVLAPNKAKAGGKANFERFTGTWLPESTSMDISLMGEAYANYGVNGGIVFMLCIGLLYNWIIIRIIKISKNGHAVLVLFLPLMFNQVVKAETDFATVFNFLTKSALIVWVVFWGMKNVLKIKI
ncbi:MAG: hypothetical protein B6D64_01000 [Bacteroidetes bacterium 4484_276]|nr:MAG: hypothetical protein B6D64_01000 [Bacteroidetes bacterium 4484_276]